MHGYRLKAGALIMIIMGVNTIHKGLSFYWHRNVSHSAYLTALNSKLDSAAVFLGQAIDYIAEMINHIQHM